MNNLLPDLGMSLIFLILEISFAKLAHIAHKCTFDHVLFIYAMTNVFSSVLQTKS
jgi:energy-converting hydrogenase Eha subunit E